MSTPMPLLPNDHHPGPRCSCRECQGQYPDNTVVPRSRTERFTSKELADMRQLVRFGSAIGVGGSVLAALLNEIELLRNAAGGVIDQMLKGNWKDDHGHDVRMTRAMIELSEALSDELKDLK